MRILVDSREKSPLQFGPLIPTRVTRLQVGDYALNGKSKCAVVEWKSAMDWAACHYSKASRERLGRQLAALRAYPHAALVIESPPPDYALSKVLPGMRREYLLDQAFLNTKAGPTFIVNGKVEAAQVVERWLRIYA